MKVIISGVNDSLCKLYLLKAYKFSESKTIKSKFNLISKYYLCNKENNLSLMKIDSNYFFACQIKEKLYDKNAQTINYVLDNNIIAYALFNINNGLNVSDIIIEDGYENYTLSIYEVFIEKFEQIAKDISPSIININSTYKGKEINILEKYNYKFIGDGNYQKIIYTNQKKGIINIYECSYFNKQR